MATDITTELIKSLREETGVSVMQVKKALEESGGDKEKALVILKKKSGELAAKKADRTLGAGTIAAYVHSTNNVGALVELSCETDFVSKNEEFKALAYSIAMHVAATNPTHLSREHVSAEDKAKAAEVFAEEVKDKPEALKAKILEGKLNAYFDDKVLLEQPYIKNPDTKIQGLLDAAVQKFGEKTVISRFVRFSVLGK